MTDDETSETLYVIEDITQAEHDLLRSLLIECYDNANGAGEPEQANMARRLAGKIEEQS